LQRFSANLRIEFVVAWNNGDLLITELPISILNNYDFNGRPLRVDFAENERVSGAATAGGKPAPPSAPVVSANPNAPSTVCCMLHNILTFH
jgi:hypothetical protein